MAKDLISQGAARIARQEPWLVLSPFTLIPKKSCTLPESGAGCLFNPSIVQFSTLHFKVNFDFYFRVVYFNFSKFFLRCSPFAPEKYVSKERFDNLN